MPQPSQSGLYVRGVDASTGVLAQPRGSVPRASNVLMTKRGSLRTCDGTGIVNAFNGVPTVGRGRAMCDFLYAPTGVARYYLRVMKALDKHLGAPQNLVTSDGGAGGTLPVGVTLFYKVTASDNVGGETDTSSEASYVQGGTAHKVVLTWNAVPNAVSYNVYRATSSGAEVLLAGTNLPVDQPQPPTATITFTDDGSDAAPVSLSIDSISKANDAGISPAMVNFQTTAPHMLSQGVLVIVAGVGNADFDTQYRVSTITSSLTFQALTTNAPTVALALGTSSSNGTVTSGSAPTNDTTQQTALYRMPTATQGVSYTDADIVALYPADAPILDGGAGGGTGGGGGTGSGGAGQQGSTPSGGIPNNVSLIPQIVQFTNQAVIALGNGYPPNVYSDASGTTVNPATISTISAISVDANGVVTVTTSASHGLTASHAGGSVLLAGVTNPVYDGVGVLLTVPDATHFTFVNLVLIGTGSSSGGTVTTTSLPIISNFTPAFPTWVASVNYAVNSITAPTTPNGYYFKAVQGGVSGTVEPTWPTGIGNRVSDGSIIWENGGQLNSSAPPPPGAAHIAVYSGSLWVWDTSPTNTSTGLDGPCSLRMSDVNNLNSWNPINQAFLDKDDGTEGMGLAVFTITAQGIPPQGSLVAFKLYGTYQIIGVFGSSNFAIQRVTTDMGCTAPRSIQFIPGYGIGRYAHLGIAVFDGVNDRIVSEQIRPYLFPSTDPDLSDIVVADANWTPISWACQTANPPMYCVFIPIGDSNGMLTRALCFDLVLKGWCIVDLPFPIGTATQVRPVTSNPITLLGTFSDGTLQRWQAGDVLWATSAAGSAVQSKVASGFRIPTTAAQTPDERLYCRRVVVRGQMGEQPPDTITIQPRVAGVPLYAAARDLPVDGDFQVQTAVARTHDRFDANVSWEGSLTIDACDLHVESKPIGTLAGFIG